MIYVKIKYWLVGKYIEFLRTYIYKDKVERWGKSIHTISHPSTLKYINIQQKLFYILAEDNFKGFNKIVNIPSLRVSEDIKHELSGTPIIDLQLPKRFSK